MIFFHIFITICLVIIVSGNLYLFKKQWGDFDVKYTSFSESNRLHMLEQTKRMFTVSHRKLRNTKLKVKVKQGSFRIRDSGMIMKNMIGQIV